MEQILEENNTELIIKFLYDNVGQINIFYYLNFCSEHLIKRDSVSILLSYYSSFLKLNNLEELIAFICGVKDISFNTLKYIVSLYPDLNIYDILLKSLYTNTGVDFSTSYKKLSDITGEKLGKNGVLELLKIAKLQKRFDAVSFLTPQKTTKKHSYINVHEDEIITLEMLNPKSYNLEDLESDLLSETKEELLNNFDIDCKDEAVLTEFCKLAIDNSIQSKKYNFDRIFGPINSMLYDDCVSSVGEKCRMLSCECKNFDIDDFSTLDINLEAWFTGVCDNCNNKILNISYAVRFPCKDGGWEGCFCSLKCLETNEIFIKDSTFIHRFNLLKDKLYSVGIFDRTSLD